jgi:hypothetical protein
VSIRRLADLPLHPLLLAAYAVLFLYGQNLGETSPGDVVVPLVFAIVGVGVVLAAANLVLRDAARAGLATSALAILFFAFGHVLGAIESPAITSGRLLVAWFVLGLIAVVAAWRVRRPMGTATRRMNLVAAIFVVIALVPIVAGEVGGTSPGSAVTRPSPAPGEGSAGPDRDIYMIVVEDIGSERILREQWGLQGASPFAFLDELGFARVADSHSNYGKTGHSLASLLNFIYLDEVAALMGPESNDYSLIYDLIDDPAAARLLQARGYEYVHIGSWWDPTARSSIADVNLGLETPSDFATAFLETTMLPAITSRLARLGIRIGVEGLEAHELQYRSALTGFAALDTTLDRPGRTFVFAHFLVPHDPYAFAIDGSFVGEEERAERSREQRFLDQSMYTMARVEAFAREALAGSDESDPIIVVTTDEGPNPLAYERHPEAYNWEQASDADLREKFEIELALYLPGVDPADAGVHTGMTLVNAFRVLFDAYFATSYGQLPDRSFVYPDKAHPYRLTDVTDRLAR